MRKLLLIVAIAFLLVPTVANAVSRVTSGLYKQSIQGLLSRGIVGGAFNVQRPLLQSEAYTMLLKASGRKIIISDGDSPAKTTEFLHGMFQVFDDSVDSDDFLDPKMAPNPDISYAIMLDLVKTRDGQVSERLTMGRAINILYKYLLIKDVLNRDGMYGKLDMHEHIRSSINVSQLFHAMSVSGISKVFLAPTGTPPNNQYYKNHQKKLLELQKKFPDKIMAWCTVDEADPNAAADFEECIKLGGKGLKLIGGHPSFYEEPLNSDNMFKVYKVADNYRVPVLLHASIINLPETQSQIEHVYSSFPNVTFVQSHYCSVIMKSMDLKRCAYLLDTYPNLNVDMSFGGGIERHLRFYKLDPNQIREFIEKYQDRLLFGVDIIFSRTTENDYLLKRMKCEFDLHSTKLYFCEYARDPDVAQIGFQLPRGILEKIYFNNPRKILGM